MSNLCAAMREIERKTGRHLLSHPAANIHYNDDYDDEYETKRKDPFIEAAERKYGCSMGELEQRWLSGEFDGGKEDSQELKQMYTKCAELETRINLAAVYVDTLDYLKPQDKTMLKTILDK